MHIHLPKSLHGWRDFLKEVGIIVIGVLIALGAEQFVQSWHWRHETEATHQALEREAGDNLQGAFQRSEQQSCADQRLEEIGLVFAAHAAGRPIHLSGPIGRPMAYYGSIDVWQVEVASQALTHMPLDQKLAFTTAFSNYENLNSVLRLEQDAWLRLDVLDSLDQLEPGDWPPLRQAYAQARSLNSRLQIITGQILSSLTLGQVPKQLDDQPSGVRLGIARVCKPLRIQ